MSLETPDSWQVTVSDGPAAAFHAATPPADTAHQLWIRRPPRPAMILGSAQPDGLVRHARLRQAGIEVCRRRSGGGLVYLDPETDCWIDVILPRSSPRWDSDIGRAFHWVGHHWAAVLGDLIQSDETAETAETAEPPPPPIEVHERVTTSPLGRVWCFADLGHGEVSLAGSKVVGLSQRRTAKWLRIQGLMLGSWPGAELAQYVDLDRLRSLQPDRHPDTEALNPAEVAAGFPPDRPAPDPETVAARFIATIPGP